MGISAAKAKKEELLGTLNAARAAAVEAQKAEAAAKKPVSVMKNDIKKAEEALVAANKKLQDFQGKPLAAYKDLVDLQAPPPPPVADPEAEVAAPPAESA